MLGRELLALVLLARGGLLRDSPDISARLEVANVARLGIVFVSSLDGLPLLPFHLGRGLASTVQHLLLVDCAGNLGRLAGEVEVLADGLGRLAAKGVIVEGVIGFIKLVSEAIVGVVKIEAAAELRSAQ